MYDTKFHIFKLIFFFSMSLHISMTEDADKAYRSQKTRNFLAALFTALLATVLFGLLLYAVVIVIAEPDKPEVVAYVTSNEDGPPTDSPVTPERVTTRPVASVQNHASIITSNSVSDVAIASVDIDTPDISDLGQSLELGVDFGAGVGDDLGAEGGGFGSDSPGGSSLVGTFYDLKQTSSGQPLKITDGEHYAIMKKFVDSGWRESTLSRYFKAPKKLYNSHIFISHRSANEAPKAYGCEDKVKPSHWIAIYRGKVVAPKSGTFRFVGMADDTITVRFNGKEVFDHGYSYASLGLYMANGKNFKVMDGTTKNDVLKRQIQRSGVYKIPVTFYKYKTMGHYNTRLNGMAAGAEFTVTANEVYPIEILISEVPGGGFSAFLLLEEIGTKDMKKDKEGNPILPLFRTNYALPDPASNKGIRPPFDPIGIVWPCVR